MNDPEIEKLTVAECQQQVHEFLDERGWLPTDTEGRYYTVIHCMEEVGEMARCITHLESRRAEVDEKRGAEVSSLGQLEGELADIYFHMLKLADAYGLNLNEAFLKTMAKNRAKFPLEKYENSGF